MWGPRHVHTWGLTQEPGPCSWGPSFQVQGGAWGLEPQTDQKAVSTVGIVAREEKEALGKERREGKEALGDICREPRKGA